MSTPDPNGANPFDTPERHELRRTVRRFVEREILDHLGDWERDGELPRSLHRLAGDLGLIGLGFPDRVGGGRVGAAGGEKRGDSECGAMHGDPP